MIGRPHDRWSTTDRGNVELRGVPGTWQLLAVDRLGPKPYDKETAVQRPEIQGFVGHFRAHRRIGACS
jgi:hypothetical protein